MLAAQVYHMPLYGEAGVRLKLRFSCGQLCSATCSSMVECSIRV
jgi:hypothetical protein